MWIIKGPGLPVQPAFGYEVNDKYIEKISAQFGLTFDRRTEWESS
ncbi:MAG: hypothetical protein ACLRI8_09535 [Agathobacter rectalis]